MLVGVEVTIIVDPRVNFVRSNIVGLVQGSGLESGEEETLSAKSATTKSGLKRVPRRIETSKRRRLTLQYSRRIIFMY